LLRIKKKTLGLRDFARLKKQKRKRKTLRQRLCAIKKQKRKRKTLRLSAFVANKNSAPKKRKKYQKRLLPSYPLFYCAINFLDCKKRDKNRNKKLLKWKKS